MSVNSKSMSKISDNASEGSFKHQYSNDGAGHIGFNMKKKKKNVMFGHNMKKGPLATQHSGGNFGDLKIENSKNQTFNSDFEDNMSYPGIVNKSNLHNSSLM